MFSSKKKSEEKKAEAPKIAGYFELFKYSTVDEKIILFFGVVGSFLSGFSTPFFGYVIGKIILMFDPQLTIEESREVLQDVMVYMFLVAAANFFFGWLGFACLQISAEKLTARLRSRYLSNLLKQEVEYFETQPIEELPGKLQGYFRDINDVSGEKVGQIL
jgi:ABC-type multidrug transport system fused ATPase/permease subunit